MCPSVEELEMNPFAVSEGFLGVTCRVVLDWCFPAGRPRTNQAYFY